MNCVPCTEPRSRHSIPIPTRDRVKPGAPRSLEAWGDRHRPAHPGSGQEATPLVQEVAKMREVGSGASTRGEHTEPASLPFPKGFTLCGTQGSRSDRSRRTARLFQTGLRSPRELRAENGRRWHSYGSPPRYHTVCRLLSAFQEPAAPPALARPPPRSTRPDRRGSSGLRAVDAATTYQLDFAVAAPEAVPSAGSPTGSRASPPITIVPRNWAPSSITIALAFI